MMIMIIMIIIIMMIITSIFKRFLIKIIIIFITKIRLFIAISFKWIFIYRQSNSPKTSNKWFLNKVALIGMNGFIKMFWQKVKTNIVLKG